MSVWFAGCTSKTKTVAENKIQWDSVRVEKTYHLLGKPENPSCNLQIDFLFPAGYENREVLAALQRHFILTSFGEPYENLTPAEAVRRYAEQYLADYKELEEDFRGGHEEEGHDHDHEISASWYSYYEYFSNEIKYNRNGLLCYAVNFENYTGGAHGAHSCKNHIVDLATGAAVQEADFFTEGYQEALSKILVKKIAEKNRAENPGELLNMGYFSLDEIYPNGNFSIDDTGLTYCFNEYEIAAYVVGITSVHLSYDEIRHLLRTDDSRVSSLAGN
jgi:hypothetical protein